MYCAVIAFQTCSYQPIQFRTFDAFGCVDFDAKKQIGDILLEEERCVEAVAVNYWYVVILLSSGLNLTA